MKRRYPTTTFTWGWTPNQMGWGFGNGLVHLEGATVAIAVDLATQYDIAAVTWCVRGTHLESKP